MPEFDPTLRRIDAPGLYELAEEVYHADPCPAPSLSTSEVDLLLRSSPRHAWFAHPRLNPQYRPDVDSKFDIGKAAHALLFEGMDNGVIVEAPDWRSKLARELRDKIRQQGKVPLLAHQHAAVEAMVSAARASWDANSDLSGYSLEAGKNEWSIAWKEGETWCRCKPDHLSKDRRLIVDAKFTEASANPATFARQINNMGYDSRAAFYLRGNAATGGAQDARYVYLVQEVSPPFVAAFIALDPAYMELGERKVEQALSLWRACLKADRWPGYLNRIHYAAPPEYVVAAQEEAELRGFEYDPATLFGEKS